VRGGREGAKGLPVRHFEPAAHALLSGPALNLLAVDPEKRAVRTSAPQVAAVKLLNAAPASVLCRASDRQRTVY
jgi:hypothetical protein